MNTYQSTIALLIMLLVVLNGKAIVNYFDWLKFKIRTTYKQRQNERNRNHNTLRRSSAI